MPALSPTMDRGNIVRWAVKEGDQVRAAPSVLWFNMQQRCTRDPAAAATHVLGLRPCT
jgi:hypothetical protein